MNDTHGHGQYGCPASLFIDTLIRDTGAASTSQLSICMDNNYATSTFPIMHLICPPKFCITFVFHFSWVLQPSQEKLKTMLMQNFGGQIRCIMGNVEVA